MAVSEKNDLSVHFDGNGDVGDCFVNCLDILIDMVRLKPFDFIRIIYRSFYIQAAWNSERMLGLGYCFCLAPFIKKAFAKGEDRSKFLKRNLQFFNTHPYMATWILGAIIKLEVESIHGAKFDTKQLDHFKKRMSESLAAIGDQLFWGKLKPIAAMLGLGLTLYNKALGLCAFLFLYNLPHLYMRVRGLLSGYKLGFDLAKFASLSKYKGVFVNLDKFAALFTGVMISIFGFSDFITNFPEGAAFLTGLLLMLVLLKLNVSVPVALIVLILGSSVVGVLIY